MLTQAVATLSAHPLRSGLGALAIAVAVATMALVDAVLGGLGQYARLTTARTLGADTFVLAQVASPGQVPRRELLRMLERNRPVVRSELRFLEEQAGAKAVYAATAQASADVTAGARRYEGASVVGTGAALPEIRDLNLAAGRFFLPGEERRGAPVVVLGQALAARLFPGRDPLGATVRVAGRAFTVIGVQGALGSSGGASLDKSAYLPLTAFERAFGAPRSLQVSGRAGAAGSLEGARDRTRAGLRARRGLRPGTPDDFEVLEPVAGRDFVLSLASRVGRAAPPISLAALLAAVVVVTNTTLVSVSRRKREIGVRRALGATRRRVLAEVVAESTLLAVLGGLAGLAVAWGAAALAPRPGEIRLAITAGSAAASLLASLLAGVAAGLYPAHRAATVDVVAALRSE